MLGLMKPGLKDLESLQVRVLCLSASKKDVLSGAPCGLIVLFGPPFLSKLLLARMQLLQICINYQRYGENGVQNRMDALLQYMGRSCALSDEAPDLIFDHDNFFLYSQSTFQLRKHLPLRIRKHTFQQPHHTTLFQKIVLVKCRSCTLPTCCFLDFPYLLVNQHKQILFYPKTPL